MSTLFEIEDAIEHLPAGERDRLEARLIARHFGDENALKKTLTEAIEEADTDSKDGKSPDEVRTLIDTWVTKSAFNGAR